MTEPILKLKPGREKSVQQRHPWIFSGAVDSLVGSPAPGDTVIVRSASGAFLARAAHSPKSQIVARAWSWDESESIDAAFFARKVAQAAAARAPLASRTNAARLVNAESDGLPGVIADRYGDFIVAQFSTAGAERWKPEIAAALMALPGARGVHERSEAEAREREGLAPASGPLAGEPAPDSLEVFERLPGEVAAAPMRFLVDPARGQKTGFYLDQRESRAIAASLAAGRETLNLFGYTGAFAVAALRGGASRVETADSSAGALALAARNLALNGFDPEQNPLVEADVFKLLRQYRDANRKFDLLILDPPKLAPTRAQADRAARAYKDLNWLSLRLLRPGGVLMTFSCSGGVSEDLFQKIVFGASLDARRDAQIIARLGQASDHPVRLSFPEGAYLKGLALRVES